MRPTTPMTFLAATLLAACGHSPATTFLVVDATPPSAPATLYAGPPLRVPFVHLPVTVDRPELVRQDAAGTIRVDDFARWSAPLGIMARNALIQDLTARLPAGAVLPPDALPVSREIRVEATVLSFDTRDGQAVATTSFRLVAPGTDPQPRVTRLSAPLANDTAPARAQAWSRIVGQLSDEVLAALLRR